MNKPNTKLMSSGEISSPSNAIANSRLTAIHPELARYPILLRHVFTASELLELKKEVAA